MGNAGPDEAKDGIKIARRNINNLRYADDTTLTAESEEELKSLLIKVKEEIEKVGLNSTFRKLSHGIWSHHFMADRMGKTRDIFKKIRDTKGTFHANMGTIKDRNGMELTEAEDIKKRW